MGPHYAIKLYVCGEEVLADLGSNGHKVSNFLNAVDQDPLQVPMHFQ